LRDLTAANRALEQEAATRKLAETERDTAEHASLAKTRFVTMVTHELRTPLNGILGYAQLLRLEQDLTARQDMQVGAIIQAGRHLLDIVDGVLDFVSIETGRMEMRPEQVSVRDLADACIVFIGPMAVERSLGLSIVCAHDTPRQIVVDPARLRQVLLNLLGNAVKYTNEGRVELRVLAGVRPGTIRMEVADTGRGIDAACRDRLFREFERLEPASSVEGTGLGLAIAARIVRQMGGTIGYMANPDAAPAKSASVFWFELPTGRAEIAGPAGADQACGHAVRTARAPG
jgi:signal transduction histidine kinase